MVDDDATWFSESVLGQATEVAQSSNVQRGRFHVTTDRGGASQSETKRALLTPDEVMNIGEDELLVKMPHRSPARLTQRRYYDDPEVRDRAPGRGESWIPPLGPARPDGPLEPPVFIEEPDDEEDAAVPEDDERERGANPVAAAGDGTALATALAAIKCDDSGDQADEMYAIGRAAEKRACARHGPVGRWRHDTTLRPFYVLS